MVLVKGGHEKHVVDPVTLEKVPTVAATFERYRTSTSSKDVGACLGMPHTTSSSSGSIPQRTSATNATESNGTSGKASTLRALAALTWHLDRVGEDGVQPGKLVYWYPVLHTQLVCDVPPFRPMVCELDMQAEHAASASAAIAEE